MSGKKVKQMNDKRLFLSLSEEDLARLDKRRAEYGMNRSQYIRYLLSSQRKAIPYSIKQKKLVDQIAQVDLHLKSLCLKEEMRPEDVMFVMEAVVDIRAAVECYVEEAKGEKQNGKK